MWSISLQIISIVSLAIIAFGFLFLLPSRQRKLNQIIFDLKKYYEVAPEEQKYAIRQNIRFFRACRTLPQYLFWGIINRPRIRGEELLEIADLPLPRWERELYENLTIVERRNFPGLTKPLRDLLFVQMIHHNRKVVLDLGCGSMEAERQVLGLLKADNFNTCPVFIGVDSAPQAWTVIMEVFSEFGDRVDVIRVKTPDNIKTAVKKPTIYFYCHDGLNAARQLKGKYDLMFSSRFRHHLHRSGKKELDKLHIEVPLAVEYDDYGTHLSWLPPLLTAWNRPILLSGAVFSHIRQPSKKSVKAVKRKNSNPKVKIFNPPGTYAKIYSNEVSWWND